MNKVMMIVMLLCASFLMTGCFSSKNEGASDLNSQDSNENVEEQVEESDSANVSENTQSRGIDEDNVVIEEISPYADENELDLGELI